MAQSRSPLIHNHWLAAYGLSGRYVLLPVAPGRLGDALRGLPALGFRGCNVTMPYKQDVMPLLDRVEEGARRIGAVNTIVVGEDGRLSGANTDGTGYLLSLREAAPGWRADAGPAVVLGAGGAARAVIVALLDAGAPAIRVLNRTPERALAIAAEFGPLVQAVAWADRDAAVQDAALLANATSLGMAGKAPLEIGLGRLPRAALVSDLVYSPLETRLILDAKARGNAAVGGLGMLLHQARPAFEAWFGVAPAVTAGLREAVQATF